MGFGESTADGNPLSPHSARLVSMYRMAERRRPKPPAPSKLRSVGAAANDDSTYVSSSASRLNLERTCPSSDCFDDDSELLRSKFRKNLQQQREREIASERQKTCVREYRWIARQMEVEHVARRQEQHWRDRQAERQRKKEEHQRAIANQSEAELNLRYGKMDVAVSPYIVEDTETDGEGSRSPTIDPAEFEHFRATYQDATGRKLKPFDFQVLLENEANDVASANSAADDTTCVAGDSDDAVAAAPGTEQAPDLKNNRNNVPRAYVRARLPPGKVAFNSRRNPWSKQRIRPSPLRHVPTVDASVAELLGRAPPATFSPAPVVTTATELSPSTLDATLAPEPPVLPPTSPPAPRPMVRCIGRMSFSGKPDIPEAVVKTWCVP